MPTRVTTTVRLTADQKRKLEALARKNDVEVSQLIRWGIDALLAHAERHGGRLLLPIDLGETFTVTPAGTGRRNPQSVQSPARKA